MDAGECSLGVELCALHSNLAPDLSCHQPSLPQVPLWKLQRITSPCCLLCPATRAAPSPAPCIGEAGPSPRACAPCPSCSQLSFPQRSLLWLSWGSPCPQRTASPHSSTNPLCRQEGRLMTAMCSAVLAFVEGVFLLTKESWICRSG